MKLLRNEQRKSYKNEIYIYIYIFVKKNLTINMLNIKNIIKLVTIVIVQGNIVMLHIAHVIGSIRYLKNEI